MQKPAFIDDVSEKISQLLAQSPAKDLEKNLKAGLSSAFSKLDLVTREEFEVQQQVLAHTRSMLNALEARVALLEAAATPVTPETKPAE